MPPRIPTRHCVDYVELVQLGVLLPWATRAFSGLSLSVLQKEDPQVFEEGNGEGSSHQREVRPRRSGSDGGTLPKEPPCHASPPEKSIVHHFLSKPNPPPPATILTELITRPKQFTRLAGELLMSYAERSNDVRAQRACLQHMIQRELVPLGHQERLYRIRSQMGSKVKRDSKVKIWAEKMWPPLPSIPDSNKYTTKQLFGRLHQLLLDDEAPPFEEAWALLKSATDYQPPLTDKKQGKQRYTTYCPDLAVINLYLSYLPPAADPLNLIRRYQASSTFPPNSQTLHLAILSLTGANSGRPPEKAVEDIMATLSYFSQSGNVPRLETWRHIANFSIEYDIPQLGAVAFMGWFACLPAWTPNPSPEAATGASMCLSLEEDIEKKADKDFRIRFEHAGTKKKRWGRTLEKLESKGWVEKLAKTGDQWGYVLKGQAAEWAEDDKKCGKWAETGYTLPVPSP